MTSRHRFVGRVGELCVARFGGVAACALGYGASWHFNDQDHPYTPSNFEAGTCGWQLQNVSVDSSGQVLYCGMEREAGEHKAAGDLASSPEPVTVTMEYPVAEPPTEKLPLDLGTRDMATSRVRPPDEDAVEGTPFGFGHAEARAFRAAIEASEGLFGASNDHEGVLPEEPEWRLAVRWLESAGVELSYGPWPVRKYVLRDMAGERHADMRMCLESLEALEKEYVVSVERSKGSCCRVALVTWDWALGLSVEDVCDELATVYG